MGLFSRTSIGIDFGHGSVKMVGITLAKRPTIVGFVEVPVESKYLPKEGMQDPAFLGAALKDALKIAQPHALSPNMAFANVSETVVFRKIIELPAVENSEEYRQIIRTQAAEFLPDSIEEVELDYQILGMLPDGINQQVMVAAVGKKMVEDYLAVFQAAKLSLTAVDPKPSAVGRAIVSPQEKGAVILIDIGSESSSISVYENRCIWVTGTVNAGNNLFKTVDGEDVDVDQRAAALKQIVSAISDELDHVLKFYANRTAQQGMPKEIRLSGRGALITGLVTALGKEVDQKVVVGKAIIPTPEGFDARFYGALGSALYPLYELL